MLTFAVSKDTPVEERGHTFPVGFFSPLPALELPVGRAWGWALRTVVLFLSPRATSGHATTVDVAVGVSGRIRGNRLTVSARCSGACFCYRSPQPSSQADARFPAAYCVVKAGAAHCVHENRKHGNHKDR